MTVVCLVILAGIFWGDFFLKNYIESHVDERDERAICKGKFLIRKHHNKGMMLNAGQKRRRLVAVVSLAFTLILTVVFTNYVKLTGVRLLRKKIILQMQSQMGIGAITSLLMKQFHIKILKEITPDIFMLKFSYGRSQWIHGQALNMR